MSIQFLVHLSLFLWKCLGKLSGITQSCLCFLKEQASSQGAALSEEQKCFYATFLLLLGQQFPGILHDAVTQTGDQDYFPFMVASREEGGWCLLLLLSLPTSYLPVEVNKPKQLSSFYKMFHLLLREQKAKCAGPSKTELWGLLGVPPVIWRKSSSKDTSYPAKPPAENELRS